MSHVTNGHCVVYILTVLIFVYGVKLLPEASSPLCSGRTSGRWYFFAVVSALTSKSLHNHKRSEKGIYFTKSTPLRI